MRKRWNIWLVICCGIAFASVTAYAKTQEAGVAEQRPLWQPINKWDRNAEIEFSAFVEQLGTVRARMGCIKLHHCLQSPEANMLWSEEDRTLKVFSDCADVPYTLRAYFAYKTKRPFQWMRHIRGGRYKIGNRPRNYADFLDPTTRDIRHFLMRLSAHIHSGYYRMHGKEEGTDTYPVDIDRKTVRPGTVYYDPKGHVLIVYKVEDNGVVRLLDGHPDNTLTRARFGEKFARGSARLGGGFRNWRWYTLNAAEDGRWQFVRETNEELAARGSGFSETAQYKKKYLLEKYWMNYYGWVRAKLSKNGMRIRPLEEFGELIESLCSDIRDRLEAVDIAVEAGLHAKDHPGRLPENIYGTTGAWEVYSTPSRDARLKASVREIHRFVNTALEWSEKGDKRLVYTGGMVSLARALEKRWGQSQELEGCGFSYKNSIGDSVSLTLPDVMDRLFALSFDPYHCPELRWGAPADSAERATCPDKPTKVSWYTREQRLRNRIERIYGERTGLDFGPEEIPAIHLGRLMDTWAAHVREHISLNAPKIAGSGWMDPATDTDSGFEGCIEPEPSTYTFKSP